jgi:hypothetical protein
MKALSAKHTPVRIIVDEGMIADDRGLFEVLFESSRFQADSQESGDPLKLAFFVPGAVTAIHMVDGHEETKGAFLKLPHRWRPGPHHHPFLHFDGARWHGFFHALDLHEAEPA